MITALIFDFDGLIVDTESPAFESWRQIYAEYNQELTLSLWEHALGTNHGFDAATHLVGLLAQHPATADVARSLNLAALRARRQQIKVALSYDQPLLPGVLDILQQADALDLPCAIASSSGRAWVEGWLRQHQIYNRFVCIRTAEDVVMTKPAPDLFSSAAAGLGRPATQCLVFEDSPNGVRAARAAGMRCVLVPGAISRHLTLPAADLHLAALNALPLTAILHHVGTNPNTLVRLP